MRAATPAPAVYQSVRRGSRPLPLTCPEACRCPSDARRSLLVLVDRRRRLLHRDGSARPPGQWHGQAAFATALSWLVGLPARDPARRPAAHRLGDRLVRSMSTATSTRSCPGQTRRSPIASHGLSLSLIKSLANGLAQARRRDARQAAATFAELQPLLAAKGVALATDTKDYMIPVAVEANTLQDRLGAVRRRSRACAVDRRRRAMRCKPGAAAGAGPQQCREADAVGAAGAPRPSPS